jgi:hypothetical protein
MKPKHEWKPLNSQPKRDAFKESSEQILCAHSQQVELYYEFNLNPEATIVDHELAYIESKEVAYY